MDPHDYEPSPSDAAAFAGKRSIARHQMIYRTLGELVGREIHALSIEALTPEEAGAGRPA